MKRRFLAFLVCMAVLLASFTGCYSAQKDGPSTASSAQTAQLGSGSGTEESVEIRTYALPEENVQAGTRYVPSPSTGGFWMWTLFIQNYIQAYDPVTKSTYIPCYQTGCEHSDAFCSAYFGEISGLAEYRGNFYAMIYYNDDTASAFVTRPVSGGPLQILASWEPENDNEVYRCGFYGLSFGKAYLTVSKETYTLTEDGQQELVGEEYSDCSFDLKTGKMMELMRDVDGTLPYMYGVWEDSVVYQTLETVKGAPAFEDWVAQQPEGTPWDLYGRQYYNYRLYSRNLKTGDEKTIVDMSENFVWTADPHKSWGQYVVYQVGRSVYVYDMETQTVKELFTYDQDWKNYNYMILDGHVIAICGTGDTCRAWAIDIADESVVELDTRGGNAITITPEYECNDYIVGLLANQTGKVEEYYISKEDFYRSNYDAAFR